MNGPNSSRQFARLTYEALAVRGAGLLGGFAANIMIARSLGASGKGLITILSLWCSLLAAVFSSGLHLATVYELGREPWRARPLLACVLPYVAGATLLILPGVFLCRDWFGHAEIPLVFFAALFAAILACNLAFALLAGLQSQSLINWLQMGAAVLYPVLVVIFFATGSLDVSMVAGCMVVIPALMALFGLSFLRRKALQHTPPEESAFAWGPYVRYALKSTAMTLGFLLYMQIVLLVLTARSSTAQVGVFSVAIMFIDTAVVIPSMIASFVLPRWAGLSQPEVSVRASRVIRLTHPISLVIAAGCALLATMLAAPVFGKDFSGVGTLAWIMVPGAWAATGITVISHYFLSQNRHTVPMMAAWMGTLLSGALAWGCLPILGGAGAAMAMSVSRLIVLAWMWRCFAHATRDTPQTLWIPRGDDIRTWVQTVNHSLHWIVRRS